MTRQNNDNKLDAVMELLIENGFEGFADVLRILLNEAMKIERDQALCAQPYERTDSRKGYANGYKSKTVDTRIGRLCVDVPQVRGDVDFYPSALERGSRSERALKLAIAEMYVKGISTRRVTDVLEKMCGLEFIAIAFDAANANPAVVAPVRKSRLDVKTFPLDIFGSLNSTSVPKTSVISQIISQFLSSLVCGFYTEPAFWHPLTIFGTSSLRMAMGHIVAL